MAFHVTFGTAYVGARASWASPPDVCCAAHIDVSLCLLPRRSAYLYGGKVVLLLLLAAASYGLSKLVAGSRAGCAAAAHCRLRSPPDCRVRRRPAILWAANCGALAWVQASHIRLFVRGSRLILTLFSAQTHGKRSFGDLLPALAALDSWRGAARCVQMRDCLADARH